MPDGRWNHQERSRAGALFSPASRQSVEVDFSEKCRNVGSFGALCLFGLFLSANAQTGHSLTFLDLEWDVRDRLPGLAQDLRDFTQETGIQVNRLPGPDGSLNQLALWRELLRKGGSSPDVCNIDAIWSGILNEYLMALGPYFSSDLFSQDPVVTGSYTVDNKLVAIPHHAYVGTLFYRALTFFSSMDTAGRQKPGMKCGDEAIRN